MNRTIILKRATQPIYGSTGVVLPVNFTLETSYFLPKLKYIFSFFLNICKISLDLKIPNLSGFISTKIFLSYVVDIVLLSDLNLYSSTDFIYFYWVHDQLLSKCASTYFIHIMHIYNLFGLCIFVYSYYITFISFSKHYNICKWTSSIKYLLLISSIFWISNIYFNSTWLQGYVSSRLWDSCFILCIRNYQIYDDLESCLCASCVYNEHFWLCLQASFTVSFNWKEQF